MILPVMTAVMSLETERGAVDIRVSCVVAAADSVAVVVNGSGGVTVGASGHESAFSSAHIKN